MPSGWGPRIRNKTSAVGAASELARLDVVPTGLTFHNHCDPQPDGMGLNNIALRACSREIRECFASASTPEASQKVAGGKPRSGAATGSERRVFCTPAGVPERSCAPSESVVSKSSDQASTVPPPPALMYTSWISPYIQCAVMKDAASDLTT